MFSTKEEKILRLKSLINQKKFDYNGIYDFIPQRPPFLMIDKVIDLDIENKKVVCQKCISANEWFLKGHFPNSPVMPGVLMIEGMAQAASIIGTALTLETDGILLFAGVEECKFSDIATVGDVLTVEAVVTKVRGQFISGNCLIKKDEKIISSCTIKAFKKVLP